jgi:hypothetical protein
MRDLGAEPGRPAIDGLASGGMRLRGGITKRCAQLAGVGGHDRVRVQGRVPAAGNETDPAAVILAPDPELREILAQGSKLVM